MTIRFDISIADYHDSPNVSHSKLKTLEDQGEAFYYERYITKGVGAPKQTADFAFGEQFECLVQRPARFEQQYIITPEGMDLRETKANPAVKPFKESIKGREHLVITHKDRVKMDRMIASMNEHAAGMAMVAASQEQATIIVDHQPFNVQCRPDWLCLEGIAETDWQPFSLDLKTCDSLTELLNARNIIKYKYHSQAAMVQRALAIHDIVEARAFLFAVEKQYPHRAAVLELDQELLAYGDRWAQAKMQHLARCYLENSWSRTLQGIRKIAKPAYLTDAA